MPLSLQVPILMRRLHSIIEERSKLSVKRPFSQFAAREAETVHVEKDGCDKENHGVEPDVHLRLAIAADKVTEGIMDSISSEYSLMSSKCCFMSGQCSFMGGKYSFINSKYISVSSRSSFMNSKYISMGRDYSTLCKRHSINISY